MGFFRVHRYVFVLAMLDAVLINISMGLAVLLKYDVRFDAIPNEILNSGLLIVLLVTCVKVILLYFFRLYGSIWRFAGIHEMALVVAAAFAGNTTVWGLSEWFGTEIPESVFLIAILTDIFLIGGIRFAYRALRRIFDRYSLFTAASRRILIIGDGEPGASVVRQFKEHPELKSIPVAIIDDDQEKLGKKINGVPIVGRFGDIPSIAEKKGIDDIIITLHSFSDKTIDEIYGTCLKTNCRVKILPSFTQMINESFVIPKIRNVNIEDLLGREPVNLDMKGISACLEGKRVLVTGGGGSIGSELCRQIVQFRPDLLMLMDNYENSLFEIQNELQNLHSRPELAVVIANIREADRLDRIFAQYRPDVVFHAAAHKHVPLMEANPGEAVKNNVFGTINMTECSQKYGVQKFVLISTDKAVNPTSIMGASKRVAELIIQTSGKNGKTEFAAVRFGNVLGSNGSVIPLFRKQIERGGPVTVTDPNVTRFFMTIPEAVHLVIQAGAMAKGGEIFVLDMGQPVKIIDLARKMIELSGLKPDIDIKIQFTGLRPGEKMFEELLLKEEGLRTTQNNKIFISSPAFTDYELLRSRIAEFDTIDSNNREQVMDYLEGIISLAGQSLEADPVDAH